MIIDSPACLEAAPVLATRAVLLTNCVAEETLWILRNCGWLGAKAGAGKVFQASQETAGHFSARRLLLVQPCCRGQPPHSPPARPGERAACLRTSQTTPPSCPAAALPRQIIDTAEGFLQNVITFPPASAFVVDSRIAPEGPRRVNFQFSGAELRLPSRALRLPPFGKGWFDNVYIDETVRVSRDIRGDTLVCVRAGPPRRFTNELQ